MLTDFSGRDTREQFIPYLVFCGLITIAIFQIVAVVAMPRPWDMASMENADLTRSWRWSLVAAAAMIPIIVALLGAAITRRLRDTGHSTRWALLPVPFLIVGLALMSQLDLTLHDGFATTFVLIFVNNLIYLATLARLLWLVTRPSHYPPPVGAQPLT